jgi:acyl carrier protein
MHSVQSSLDEIIQRLIEEVSNKNMEHSDMGLISEGILDSMRIMTLIAMIEEHFDIEFDEDDLVVKNFSTARNIVNLLMSKFEKEMKLQLNI